jgi:hypothetical protein
LGIALIAFQKKQSSSTYEKSAMTTCFHKQRVLLGYTVNFSGSVDICLSSYTPQLSNLMRATPYPVKASSKVFYSNHYHIAGELSELGNMGGMKLAALVSVAR